MVKCAYYIHYYIKRDRLAYREVSFPSRHCFHFSFFFIGQMQCRHAWMMKREEDPEPSRSSPPPPPCRQAEHHWGKGEGREASSPALLPRSSSRHGMVAVYGGGVFELVEVLVVFGKVRFVFSQAGGRLLGENLKALLHTYTH